eukprot:SAG11_NODE_11681_length_744_cov_3.924031_2_plen_66_part_00
MDAMNMQDQTPTASGPAAVAGVEPPAWMARPWRGAEEHRSADGKEMGASARRARAQLEEEASVIF